MRDYYALETFSCGVHYRSVQFSDLVEDPLDKYVGKYIFHITGLIKLWPGSRGYLMEP